MPEGTTPVVPYCEKEGAERREQKTDVSDNKETINGRTIKHDIIFGRMCLMSYFMQVDAIGVRLLANSGPD